MTSGARFPGRDMHVQRGASLLLKKECRTLTLPLGREGVQRPIACCLSRRASYARDGWARLCWWSSPFLHAFCANIRLCPDSVSLNPYLLKACVIHFPQFSFCIQRFTLALSQFPPISFCTSLHYPMLGKQSS